MNYRMHFEPHAALGWALGNVGGADRRLRKWCLIGAILPDLDAIPFVFGAQAYGRWHHTFGHNVFLWGLFVGWVTWSFRSKRALFLSFLSFGSHLLTDAQFSGWELQLFWPVSHAGYLFRGAVGLNAPINTHLVYYSFLVVALLVVLYQRTPMDIFSGRLDRLFLSCFQRKLFACSTCQRSTNQLCSRCGHPVCIRHSTVRKDIRLMCPDCVSSGK
jgi:membrane-bound metal-dependent hydrolase YbcI (DUF457 family)